tara:strand:+ start:688 stop:1818 length:1131 start_codon:yes stop_codon:yes gene_type:complete
MKLKVENFQSIKSAEIEVNGLTVITGENSIGKSALARAFNGVFTNLRGDAHVRNGESYSSVSVTFDDGNEVLWEKGKKKNRYVINGKEIDKVGTGVPDEVKNLGVTSVKVDGKDVYPQMAKQFQNIFLIDLPPSALSSALSDVELIHQLENASSKARSEIRDTKSRLKVKREDLNKAENNLALYEDFDPTKFEDYEQAEQAKNVATERVNKVEALSHKKERIDKAHKVLKEVETVSLPTLDLSEFENLNQLISLSKRREALTRAIEALEEIETCEVAKAPDFPNVKELERIQLKRNKLGRAVQILDSVNEIDISSPPDDNSDIINSLERKRKLTLGITLAQEEIVKLNSDLESVQKEIRKGVCPVCLRGGDDKCHD